jgi:hypothetical protein
VIAVRAKQQIAIKRMKTRHIGLALAAIAVTGLWFGRLAWRAHQNLVTLYARNMPLAEVVSTLERQTWEKIKFDKSMSARITLNVKDAPLWQVLDLVAERAGGRWQRTFAVGSSDSAMKGLESVLEGAEKLEAAGWTNLAPRFSEVEHANLPDASLEQNQATPGRLFHRTLQDGGGGGGGIGGGGSSGGSASSMTTVTSVTISSGGVIDQWSSERLVLENSLLPLLGTEVPDKATAETAAHVASCVHGRSRLYYALEKSPFGTGGMTGPPSSGPRRAGQEPAAPSASDVGAMVAQALRQQRLLEMSRSPEEQVERRRQNSAAKTRRETNQEGH